MTDNKKDEKKEYDIYRDSLLRYLGELFEITPRICVINYYDAI